VRADGRRGAVPRLPVVQKPQQAAADLGQVGELAVEIGGFAPDEVADVGARRAARPPDRDDILDLAEREAEPLRLPNEGEQRERVRPVDAVAGGSAPGRSEDAGRFVQPERLPSRPGALRHLADTQSILAHSHTLNPAPGGKVKGLL